MEREQYRSATLKRKDRQVSEEAQRKVQCFPQWITDNIIALFPHFCPSVTSLNESDTFQIIFHLIFLASSLKL